jgi:hypothetical protein
MNQISKTHRVSAWLRYLLLQIGALVFIVLFDSSRAIESVLYFIAGEVFLIVTISYLLWVSKHDEIITLANDKQDRRAIVKEAEDVVRWGAL